MPLWAGLRERGGVTETGMHIGSDRIQKMLAKSFLNWSLLASPSFLNWRDWGTKNLFKHKPWTNWPCIQPFISCVRTHVQCSTRGYSQSNVRLSSHGSSAAPSPSIETINKWPDRSAIGSLIYICNRSSTNKKGTPTTERPGCQGHDHDDVLVLALPSYSAPALRAVVIVVQPPRAGLGAQTFASLRPHAHAAGERPETRHGHRARRRRRRRRGESFASSGRRGCARAARSGEADGRRRCSSLTQGTPRLANGRQRRW